MALASAKHVMPKHQVAARQSALLIVTNDTNVRGLLRTMKRICQGSVVVLNPEIPIPEEVVAKQPEPSLSPRAMRKNKAKLARQLKQRARTRVEGKPRSKAKNASFHAGRR